jgi:hypothetical protein
MPLECPRGLVRLIDPAVHWCGSVEPHGAEELAHPEPDLFQVGMKSYGRSTSFLMATGYQQVRSVVAALTGDRRVAHTGERPVRSPLPLLPSPIRCTTSSSVAPCAATDSSCAAPLDCSC